MDDIFVRFKKMPMRIQAFTLLDENGDYNMYINDRLSTEGQRNAYDHEYNHIADGHFYSYEPTEELEREADEKKG